ncbi:MAG: hypothetical protein JO241_06235 [Candidatus Eremiobacteraeota bacterium]|nr:hypothetical protein [Candidatus Eremiobacteraeota bacterium]MBV8583579.1 hypothetical protein [Candidatus Eremiobacteraeota bacterium]
MDVISAVAARYCLRADARAYLELWGLFAALIGCGITVLVRRQRAARPIAVSLFVLALMTAAVTAALFYACHSTAAASHGLVLPTLPANSSWLECITSNASGLAIDWIAIVLSGIAAVALLLAAKFRWTRVWPRIFAGVGAGVLVLFAVAAVLGVLWTSAWCGSNRLF